MDHVGSTAGEQLFDQSGQIGVEVVGEAGVRDSGLLSRVRGIGGDQDGGVGDDRRTLPNDTRKGQERSSARVAGAGPSPAYTTVACANGAAPAPT